MPLTKDYLVSSRLQRMLYSRDSHLEYVATQYGPIAVSDLSQVLYEPRAMQTLGYGRERGSSGSRGPAFR